MSIKFRILVLAILVTGSLTAVAQQSKQIIKDLPVKEFNSALKEHPGLLLDVRTKGEVAKGAIPGSTNIDFFDDAFESKIDKLDKTKPVYVYCASGGRSGEATEMMQKKGFKEVYNLQGGYSAWLKDQKK